MRRSGVVVDRLEPRRLCAVSVGIDAAQRFQTMDGFGTTLASYLDGVYESDAFHDLYYQDLGASMLRVSLNFQTLHGPGNDLETPIVLGEDLQANIGLFDFDHPNIARYGNFAKAAGAKKIDSFKLFASIWTPPHWMKGPEVNAGTGNPVGQGPVMDYTSFAEPNSAGGSLIDTPENLTQFARFCAAYAKGFEQKFGVAIDTLSLQNELAFHEPYNSCVYTPELYVKAVKAVAAQFRADGITTKLLGPEDVGVGAVSQPSLLARQMSYINAINADPQAKQDLAGYVIHGYANDGVTPNRSPTKWAEYASLIGTEKPSWMTELSGEYPTWDGAMLLAQNAQDAMVYGNASAWIYHHTQVADTEPNRSALTASNSTTAFKYVAAKHVFRYVRPGAERVSATPSDPSGVYVSAFAHDAQHTLTSVLINAKSAAEQVTLNVSGLGMSAFDIAYLSTGSAVWTPIAPIGVSNGVATFTLPARSILTLRGATTDLPAPTTQTVQAESATLTGGTKSDASWAGFSGSGYADYAGQGSAIDFAIARQSAGAATLTLRYANGSTANRPLQVLVNNVVVGTIACAPTGGWDKWASASLSNVSLPTGAVTIRAIASTTVGGANVDQLTIASGPVTPPPPPPSDGNVTIEAESASMTGGTVKSTSNAGYTGAGFADYAGQGSAVTYSLTRANAGNASLTFRYANGSTTNRPLQILVNNVVVGTVACAPTGSWTTWANVSLASVQLPAGAVSIKAIASTSAGGANVDSLQIGTATTPPPPPPPTNAASISGVLWTETDADGKREAGESLLANKQVFIDLDRDGVIDANEKVVTSNASGVYTFTGLAAGTYRVGRIKQTGYWFTSPRTGYWEITLGAGEKRTGVDIGTANKPPV